MRPFQLTLRSHGAALTRQPLQTLQVNLGKLCNQACLHCHVEAGPGRTERMEPATVDRILELLAGAPGVGTVDVTGGAPELNPSFRRLVRESRRLGRTVLDRCNLTVLLLEGQEDTADFLAREGVQLFASLPCYSRETVDRQRGRGVFERSLQALRRLNAVGYGLPGSELALTLVYNPSGPSLPPPQGALEEAYRERLRQDFGLEFTRLVTITNMPVKRFLADLERTGRREEYLDLLARSFNPATLDGLMCRTLVSVGWDGQIYDCDFNGMLDLPQGRRRRSIWDLGSLEDLARLPIAVGDHCYGCTAGAGSSCSGALA